MRIHVSTMQVQRAKWNEMIWKRNNEHWTMKQYRWIDKYSLINDQNTQEES